MRTSRHPHRIAVLTSGGDAPGMNAAVRAVVRTAERQGVEVVAVREGFRGLVDGGDAIHSVTSVDVGGVLHRGGTWIGTARSEAFRERKGRLAAARNLLIARVDALVVIGGDGSLTGAAVLRAEWPGLLEELVASGDVERELADAHPVLVVVGIVGSIDNDFVGTEMTIGADSALHRITEAVDAIHSTASSHQRSFVIEVMGRACGYLALMAALATGAQWVFLPERPPRTDDWVGSLRAAVRRSREVGRRQNLVIVAEGARDRHGRPITTEEVRLALAEELGEDTRVTKLGHVQRGGSPSAFDRNLATQCGYHAVRALLERGPDDEPVVVGVWHNAIARIPLQASVAETLRIAELADRGQFDEALRLRGDNVVEAYRTMRMLVRSAPRALEPAVDRRRLLVLHAGGPAPGMNTAVRAAVRVARDAGHLVLGARHGFEGVLADDLDELDWMSVSGWVSHGGAELGTSRRALRDADVPRIAERFEQRGIDGVLIVGGHTGYATAHRLSSAATEHRALRVPFVCLPATINNDLPATEVTIGADTAVNNIVEAVDKIKQSAVATRRCHVVEVMGNDSGYLAMAGGMATGAERVYIPEYGISMDELRDDVDRLKEAFRAGQRLGLVIRSQDAEELYTTPFLWAFFATEGENVFEVRQAVLGHLQQGGDPSPFDRIHATRLAARGMEHLLQAIGSSSPGDAGTGAMVGVNGGSVTFTPLVSYPELLEPDGGQRPIAPAWLPALAPVATTMALPTSSPAHDVSRQW